MMQTLTETDNGQETGFDPFVLTNTILFGVGAGLVAYCWYLGMSNGEILVASAVGSMNYGGALLLSTAALLLGGFFFSLVGVLPDMERKNRDRRVAESRAHIFRHQAYSDAQTGLRNRRYFEGALRAYVQEFARAGVGLGLILIDLDHFKQVNDRHGHDIGDKVLKEAGRQMSDLMGDHDVAARIGGEEFAVLTRAESRESLMALAERLRKTIAGIEVASEAGPVQTTASFGIATTLETLFTDSDLFQKADERLYAAKRSGRNRIEF